MKSRKQGPSQRKVRRWVNDHVVHLAKELTSTKSRSALLLAHEEAHLYRDICDFKRSDPMDKFLNDESLKVERQKFFEGETPVSVHVQREAPPNLGLTVDEKMARIEPRLRRVVVKACSNSYPAAKVVEAFEDYLLGRHGGDWWNDLLLEAPTEGFDDVSFYFDARSSTGGFHRLLLHAVAQFHGFKVRTRTCRRTVKGSECEVRMLSLRGVLADNSSSIRLVDVAAGVDNETKDEGWALVRATS